MYFPAELEGLLVYDLLTGRRVRVLKGHLDSGPTCCTAAQYDARVFTGGADFALHAWTPPPRGLAGPAPMEVLNPCAEPIATLTRVRAHRGAAALEDIDAWSDNDDL